MLKLIARIETFVDDLCLWLDERRGRIQAKNHYKKYIEETKEFWQTHCHGCGQADPWLIIHRPGKKIQIVCAWCGRTHYDS